MKRLLNKWQLHFIFGRDHGRMESGWKRLEFGILKLHSLPEEAYAFHSAHYKGFIVRLRIWLPIEVV